MNKKTKVIIAVLIFVIIVGLGIVLRTARQKFTVKFNYNGGGENTTQRVKAADTIEEPTPPTRTDAVFLYWQLNGHEFDFTSKIDRDMELIAVWQLNDEGKPR